MKKLKLSLISFFGLMKKNFIDPMKKSVADRRFWNLLALISVGLVVLAVALGLLYGVGILLVALWNAFLTVWNWLALNFWALVFAIALIIWGRVYIREFFRKKREDQQQLRLQQQQLISEEEQRQAEQNYTQIKAILLGVLQDVGKLCNIQPPVDLSSLDAPVHSSMQNGVLFFHFSLLKNGDLDARKAKALIQDRIRQLCYSGQIAVSPSTLIYKNQSFPILMVDRLEDYQTYAQATLVWASESYLSGYLNRKYPGGGLTGRSDDRDF